MKTEKCIFQISIWELIYIGKGGAHMNHCMMAIRRQRFCEILFVQYSTIIYSLLQ